jgi:hypothetical protein
MYTYATPRLSPKTIVGNLTLITRGIVSCDSNGVLIGIPAREMTFVMPDNTTIENASLSSNHLSIHDLLLIFLWSFISKCVFIALYSSIPTIVASLFTAILYCVVHHCSNLLTKNAHI